MDAPTDTEMPRRKAMKASVGVLLADHGFEAADELALETLTEMITSFVVELGRSAKAYSELACRIEPMVSDIVLALVEMGQKVDEIPYYAKRAKQTLLLPPALAPPNLTPRIMQSGEKKPHPSHIPDYLPPFPDPHSYIHSQTHKAPNTEYQLIREKAASQKRDVERALTRFIAKTGDTENLFPDDPYAFPLIANRPKTLPYLEALLPKDEDITSLDEETVTPQPQVPPPVPPETPQKPEKVELEKPATVEPQEPTTPTGKSGQEAGTAATEPTDGDGPIDNPYLRPITMPKLKGVGKKHKW